MLGGLAWPTQPHSPSPRSTRTSSPDSLGWWSASREAANGLRLISTLHVDRPDLILLDVMMSWIDGFELCRAVKKNDEFRDIPVIFISAKKTANDIRTGLAAGASDYFSKPIDMERLL